MNLEKRKCGVCGSMADLSFSFYLGSHPKGGYRV